MSDSPLSRPLTVLPAHQPRRPSPASPFRWILRIFVLLLLVLSLSVNGFLLFVLAGLNDLVSMDDHQVNEKHYAGGNGPYKVAVVRIDGVLMEGLMGFVQKEIDRASQDTGVKAVVLRINSPGGSITASDDLHRRISELRDGSPAKHTAGKPLVVSMASVAASGGYYIAMPASIIVAERTTITGSIGVYAALPNVEELGKKIGFSMKVIKAGEVKDSGSPFHQMTSHEQEVWQSMVDHAYLQFLQVVEQGRPNLKGKLQEDLVIERTLPIRNEKGGSKHLHFTRYRADGGIFTANEAKEYGLVDQIGYLDDAIALARNAGGLSEDCEVVTYEKPSTLMTALLSGHSRSPQRMLNPGRLAAGATPRLWYLAPQADLAGVLAAMGQDD